MAAKAPAQTDLQRVFEQHPERRYIMFGGKGGLGKTTFSAATAYWLARQGKRVLVFSVDPQASLSDIFQQDIFGKGPVKIMENLWAQEIDADSHIKAYQDEIRKKILDMYGLDSVPEEIENYIQAASAEPAMEEMIILDTRKAAELFTKFDVPLAGYVVNRVLPEELAGQNVPEYLKKRLAMQKRYVGEIQKTLGKDVLAYVPEMERDVTGLPAIERLAGIMYGQ